jgi:hypothetical protein
MELEEDPDEAIRNLVLKPAKIIYFLTWIAESRKEASGTSLYKSTVEQRVQTLYTNTMNGELPRGINLQIQAASNSSQIMFRVLSSFLSICYVVLLD